MSFSFTIPAGPIADFGTAADTAVANFKQLLEQSDTQPSDEALESVQAAISAAQAIIDSGVVGSGTVAATINGHANPGHAPTQGWANDSVTICVYCADSPATPPAEPAADTTATADSGRHQA